MSTKIRKRTVIFERKYYASRLTRLHPLVVIYKNFYSSLPKNSSQGRDRATSRPLLKSLLGFLLGISVAVLPKKRPIPIHPTSNLEPRTSNLSDSTTRDPRMTAGPFRESTLICAADEYDNKSQQCAQAASNHRAPSLLSP